MASKFRKIIEERGFRIELVIIKDSYDNIYYNYLLMKECNYSKLLNSSNNREVVDLNQFGKVLLSGKGENPSDFHKEIIKIFLKELKN